MGNLDNQEISKNSAKELINIKNIELCEYYYIYFSSLKISRLRKEEEEKKKVVHFETTINCKFKSVLHAYH